MATTIRLICQGISTLEEVAKPSVLTQWILTQIAIRMWLANPLQISSKAAISNMVDNNSHNPIIPILEEFRIVLSWEILLVLDPLWVESSHSLEEVNSNSINKCQARITMEDSIKTPTSNMMKMISSSTLLFSWTLFSRNFFFSFNKFLDFWISILIWAYFSASWLMDSSLLAIVARASSHCCESLCLSSWCFLNSSAVLSSSIWAAWVSVISCSSSFCFLVS